MRCFIVAKGTLAEVSAVAAVHGLKINVHQLHPDLPEVWGVAEVYGAERHDQEAREGWLLGKRIGDWFASERIDQDGRFLAGTLLFYRWDR
jgi:hypothetical protein